MYLQNRTENKTKIKTQTNAAQPPIALTIGP